MTLCCVSRKCGLKVENVVDHVKHLVILFFWDFKGQKTISSWISRDSGCCRPLGRATVCRDLFQLFYDLVQVMLSVLVRLVCLALSSYKANR